MADMATNPRDVRYWPKRTLERRGDDRQQLNGAASCNHETALHYCCRHGFGSRVNYGHGRRKNRLYLIKQLIA
jgi:hypothetical protein